MGKESGPGRFRILDKDLERVANSESAGAQSRRPVLRLGLALIFAALASILAGGASAGVNAGWALIPGVMIGAFLALSIGANDSANALGPAVGAGAISARAGLALVALAEIAGALTGGERVGETLSSGLLGPAQLARDGAATVMLAAMIAAAGWIALATWAGAPVSTTHAVVGGIAGAGIAVFGAAGASWRGLGIIASGWMVSPVIAGLIAAVLLALLRSRIQRAPDPILAGTRWFPVIVGVLAAVLAGYALALSGLPGAGPAAGITAAAGAGAWWLARRRIAAERAAGLRPRQAMKRLFGPPLVAAAMLIAYGHGANDVANVAAPLSVIAGDGDPGAPLWLATGALGFALGATLFGRRLVRMVGSRITRLNPARALCVTLATALVLLGATWAGLPVSTTHVAVGAVFGVGFYREWEERRLHPGAPDAPLPPEELHRRRLVRRSAVLRTLAAWAVTVPITGALSAVLALALGAAG
ncbi:inorganic phosphate transporter [Paracoccus contaminans]|uniref:Phosphate transporter n=1 Tax=Paracoccus contaminans TaxID=1945662 RepID=A0A1W6D0M5_9RHOB|nr:inorganic phosphate transporter [Paracoccus contaminans]ARJ70672.1 hypothetical protein B0A89_02925 [Paracoccus contaminans]